MEYTCQFLKPQHEYYAQWQEFRQLRRNWLWRMALFVPIVFPFGVIGELLFHNNVFVFLAIEVYAAFFSKKHWQALTWPCQPVGNRSISHGGVRVYGPILVYTADFHATLPAIQKISK